MNEITLFHILSMHEYEHELSKWYPTSKATQYILSYRASDRHPLDELSQAVLPTRNWPNRGASTSETVAQGSEVAQFPAIPLKLL